MNGPAGTGKSTIALTIVRKMEVDDIGPICIFFFCSRKSEISGKPVNIFFALARKLAQSSTAFAYFLAIASSNPGILDGPPREQMNELLIEPLKKSGISAVIVIDGLDLCNEETVSAILGSLTESVSKIPKVKFLITSRPTAHIREGFGLLVNSGHVAISDLHEADPRKVMEDIRLLFEYKLSKIRKREGLPDDWPAEGILHQLCGRAGGLFAYAAAQARYMDSSSGVPSAKNRPDRLLKQKEDEFLKINARARGENSICALYMSVLQDAFGDYKPGDGQKVRSVLGAVALAEKSLSPSAIATLLGFDREHVLLCLKSAESLILHEDSLVKPLHKSFVTFLTDSTLCEDKKFYVSPPIHHEDLLIGCLKLMNNWPKENLGEFSGALEYACASWHIHLAGTTETEKITEHLHPFLEQNFPNCQKACRGIAGVDVTGVAMDALMKWLLQVSSVLPVPTPGLFSQ